MGRFLKKNWFWIMAVVLFAIPFIFTRAFYSEEARQFESEIEMVSASDLQQKLESQEAQARVVMIYTSWCYICDRLFPIVDSLSWAYENRGVDFLALSVDQDIMALSQFYVTRDFIVALKPRMLVPEDTASAMEVLNNHGIAFKGGIPHTALMNREGEVVKEYLGMVSRDELDRQLEDILAGDSL